MKRLIVGVSGASGIILAYKAICALAERGYGIELVMTKAALYTATLELGKEFGRGEKFVKSLPEFAQKNVTFYEIGDIGAAICSGTYKTEGMMVIPCSMATVAAISLGLGDNALRRAADVMLKERRPLAILFREAPLSTLHLEHLLKLSQIGATILPPIPAWYLKPKSVDEIENFIVGRALDAFHIEHNLYTPWH